MQIQRTNKHTTQQTNKKHVHKTRYAVIFFCDSKNNYVTTYLMLLLKFYFLLVKAKMIIFFFLNLSAKKFCSKKNKNRTKI